MKKGCFSSFTESKSSIDLEKLHSAVGISETATIRNLKVGNNKLFNMKKIKLLAWLLLVTLIFTFSSCEKDLYDDSIKTSQRELKSEFVTGNDARILISKLEKSLKNKFTLSDVSSSRISIASIGTVRYDEIVKVTDSTGKSTYTFKVEHPDSSISKFFNLILQEKAGGNIVKLMEYTMSPEFAQQFAETFNYKDFRGKLSTYTIVNETPCPDEDIISVVVGQVGGSGGGSGDPIGTPGSGTPGSGTPGSGTPGSGTPGSGTPGSGTPGSGSAGGGGGADADLTIGMIIDCIGGGGDWDYTDGNCIANPRYFRMAVDTSIDPVEEPCNPSYYVIVITPDTECERELMLSTTEHLEWFSSNYGTADYAGIMSLVNEDCTPEKRSLANELIREIKRGSKIDFENKIIIDSSFVNNQKANCIYNKMRNINAFNKALEPFETTTPVAFLKLMTEDMGNTGRGVTEPPLSNLNIITIKINNNTTSQYGINYQANLLLAQTIIHEVIHAELFRKIMIAISVGSYVEDVNVIRNALSSSEFDVLSEYFRQGQDWPHSFMADHMRNTIARITQEFATGIPVTNPSPYYKTLAWRGLMHYGTVQSWTEIVGPNPDFPGPVAIEIDQTIYDYETTHANETCH
jgi:hypothetical protein